MKDKQKKILELLELHYHDVQTALVYHNTIQLLIAVMLSAQTTDVQVNKITQGLFARYPTAPQIAALSEAELIQEIKGCGLYRTKAKNILATLKIILAQYGGEVPAEREALLRLPGVGRKTAHVIMAVGFGKAALAVDTHVFRVANRLGLSQGKTPLEVEKQLVKLIPKDNWASAHHWLIWHGRKMCHARKPNCQICFLRDLCATMQQGVRKKGAGIHGSIQQKTD